MDGRVHVCMWCILSLSKVHVCAESVRVHVCGVQVLVTACRCRDVIVQLDGGIVGLSKCMSMQGVSCPYVCGGVRAFVRRMSVKEESTLVSVRWCAGISKAHVGTGRIHVGECAVVCRS